MYRYAELETLPLEMLNREELCVQGRLEALLASRATVANALSEEAADLALQGLIGETLNYRNDLWTEIVRRNALRASPQG